MIEGDLFTSQVYEKPRSDRGDSNQYQYHLTIDELSQNIANNTSTLLFTLYMRAQTGTNTLMWNNDVDGNAPYSSIIVDGVEYTSMVSDPSVDGGTAGGSYYIHNGRFRRYRRSSTELPICRQTLTIPHDNNGEKFISVQFKWYRSGPYSSYRYYPADFASNGATVQLKKIPRNGVINAPSAILLDSNPTDLAYSITSYADYYYDLEYTLDGHTVTALEKQSINATTYPGTITASWLLHNCSLKQANLVFTLKTYALVDGVYTQIGSNVTQSVVVMIDTTYYAPSISGTIGIGTSPINGVLIAGYSTASFAYSTNLPVGANLASVSFSTSYGTFAEYSPTLASGTVYTNILPSSTDENINLSITATVTDSRGATYTYTSPNRFKVWPYSPPEITATAYRVGSNDPEDTTEDGAGLYVYITYSAVTNYTVNGLNSIQSVTCTRQGESYANPSWVALDADKSAIYVFTATDNVSSSTLSIRVGYATYSADYYDDGTGTVLGAAFAGPIAEPYKIKLGNGTITTVDLMGSVFQMFNDSTMLLAKLSNRSNANSLYPATNQCIGLYYSTSTSGRSNWPPNATAYACLLSYRITAGAGVQFCWVNGQNTLWQRVRSSSTWGEWKSITFA